MYPLYSSRWVLRYMVLKCHQHCPLQKRTLFNIFDIWKETPPKIDVAKLPYSVVTPATVSVQKTVPDSISKPEYADTGIPGMPSIYPILANDYDIEMMRAAGSLARKVLDLAKEEVKVGVTTDHLDEVVHQACIDNNAYPSPLNYKHFPKSVCTSVNNVMVHGIPDNRRLIDGDIINIDVTVCLNGYHGDVSETCLVGNVDDTGRRLVNTAKQCLHEAIRNCAHKARISNVGNTIAQRAKSAGFVVCPGFVGHGIGKLFHCKPHIWHFANNYKEVMEDGMIFTIEPVLLEYQDVPVEHDDGWTIYSKSYARSAQFEHTVLIRTTGIDVLTAGSGEDFTSQSLPDIASSTKNVADESEVINEKGGWKFKT